MPEIVIKQTPIKRLLYFIISIILLLMGFFLFKSYFIDGINDKGYLIEALLGFFLLVIGLVIFLTVIFKRRPKLIINKEGINDKLSIDSLGFIPWSDIENINIIEVAKQNFISLKIVNFNDKIKRLSHYKQTIYRLGMDIKLIYQSDYNELVISTMYTSYSIDQLFNILNKYHQEYSKNLRGE